MTEQQVYVDKLNAIVTEAKENGFNIYPTINVTPRGIFPDIAIAPAVVEVTKAESKPEEDATPKEDGASDVEDKEDKS